MNSPTARIIPSRLFGPSLNRLCGGEASLLSSTQAAVINIVGGEGRAGRTESRLPEEAGERTEEGAKPRQAQPAVSQTRETSALVTVD